MTNIILSGGSGTRLWPISKKDHPKQFSNLLKDQSLLELTIKRNTSFCTNTLIVSNIKYENIISNFLNEYTTALYEPVGKNTAAAIALAAFKMNKEEILLITPSDHLIQEKNYASIIQKAEELAKKDNLVTFGIKTNNSNTGYGYIEVKEDRVSVNAFHEKPDLERAVNYHNNSDFYWNSGIFCFKAKVFLEELKKYNKEIYDSSLLAYNNSIKTNRDIKIKLIDMSNIPEDSIDYAIMEKSDIVKVVLSDIIWNDIGTFDSLSKELKIDENKNSSNTQMVNINSKNNMALTTNKKLVSFLDVNNLILVESKNEILITKKEHSQNVKDLVKKLKEENYENFL